LEYLKNPSDLNEKFVLANSEKLVNTCSQVLEEDLKVLKVEF
jgi:hypothetical protein